MMDGLPYIGKMLIVMGFIIILLGILFIFADKIPLIGKLPGDITIKKGNVTFYVPIVTCLIISFILTLILYLSRR